MDVFENLTILCDTREQVNSHITNYFKSNDINYEEKKLDFGDYSFKLEGLTLESEISIERKYCIDEICKNFSNKYGARNRFRNEFIRAKEHQANMFLLIENGSLEKIKKHQYRSLMHPNSLIGSLNSWKERYNIYVMFCNKNNTGKVIYDLFKRYITNVLLKEVVKT